MGMILEVKNASFGYSRQAILKNISFEVNAGEFLTLLGPNGVGKTTLFKTILGFLRVLDGEIIIDGKNIRNWDKMHMARTLGYVPQSHASPFAYSVMDVVLMGRLAHLGAFSSPSKADLKIAEESLERLGITYLKDHLYTRISGGERQMVLIARALTQKPTILILDEPTSNLDYGNQVRVLLQIKDLSETTGLSVIMTSHFPNHAFLCSSRVALINKNGFTIGNADDIITESNMKDTYGIRVKITRVGDDGYYVKDCVAMAKANEKTKGSFKKYGTKTAGGL
jgi:iron complex transport system ATP-binding protein